MSQINQIIFEMVIWTPCTDLFIMISYKEGSMLNQVILIGRLTHDPEVKVLEDGRKVSYVSLAVQRPFKNMEGNYDTDFIKITVWEGLASSIESYCSKGVLVAVKARIQTWKYEISEDRKLNMLEVIAERISFLSSSAKAEFKSSEESSEK
jgi:single-strand DNA-binding protein